MTEADFGFQCRSCRKWHEGLPDIAFDEPHHYAQLSDQDKETIAEKSDDLCSIEDRDFFIRAVLTVPIKGSETACKPSPSKR